MTLSLIAVIAVGGALGAAMRHLVERAMNRRHSGGLPWGLFTVNLVGSAIAGAVLGGTSGLLRTFLLVGVCGALTTYSGFGAAVRSLWSQDRRAAWVTIIGMTAGSIAAAAITYAIASAATG